MQKQSYENTKKYIASELEYILKDPSIVVVSDWLKVRGTLRDWTKLWAVLKPGYMLLYRSPISMVWKNLSIRFVHDDRIVGRCLGWHYCSLIV